MAKTCEVCGQSKLDVRRRYVSAGRGLRAGLRVICTSCSLGNFRINMSGPRIR